MLMQNLSQSDQFTFDLNHFQVEELEERLENKWEGSAEVGANQTEGVYGKVKITKTF